MDDAGSGFSTYWGEGRGAKLSAQFRFWIFATTAVYPLAIVALRHFMKNRPPLKLKWANFIWNFSLSIMSFVGWISFLCSFPKLVLMLTCPESDLTPTVRAVIGIFTLTKSLEYGDTMFLILKKKPVIFLHWYHHMTVTLYCFSAMSVPVQFAHTFCFINLVIHSMMYGYYALCSIAPGARYLRIARPYITQSQILQMLIGIVLSIAAYFRSGLSPAEQRNAQYAVLMYLSYAYLFGKFYVENFHPRLMSNRFMVALTLHIVGTVGAFKPLTSTPFSSLTAIGVLASILTCALMPVIHVGSSIPSPVTKKVLWLLNPWIPDIMSVNASPVTVKKEREGNDAFTTTGMPSRMTATGGSSRPSPPTSNFLDSIRLSEFPKLGYRMNHASPTHKPEATVPTESVTESSARAADPDKFRQFTCAISRQILNRSVYRALGIMVPVIAGYFFSEDFITNVVFLGLSRWIIEVQFYKVFVLKNEASMLDILKLSKKAMV